MNVVGGTPTTAATEEKWLETAFSDICYYAYTLSDKSDAASLSKKT